VTRSLAIEETLLNNTLKRTFKAPNMYFMDAGLCAYLTRWITSDLLEISAMSGAFLKHLWYPK